MATPPSLLSLGAAILAVLAGAAPSGLVAANAKASVIQPLFRRREEEDDTHALLLLAPRDESRLLLAEHSSHSSHSSHESHSSHYSGSRGWNGGGGDDAPIPNVPAPRPPKPAFVSFVAYPGGHIFVDGKPVGLDATGRLKLSAGKHEVRVENQFVGTGTVEVDLNEGQTGAVRIDW